MNEDIYNLKRQVKAMQAILDKIVFYEEISQAGSTPVLRVVINDSLPSVNGYVLRKLSDV